MATSAFDTEIERFIKPIRGLYKEYVTTIDDFLAKNEEMMEDRIIISDSMRDGFLVYEMFGDGEEGEIIREKVQTWICDNRMEVTNAVSTTLRAKKVTFGDWFRSSENNRSPDELIVYCLAKMSKCHTVIFNKSFAWSTLLNYMSYTDNEIVERSTVLLIYVGVSNYAIIQSKPKIPYNIGKSASPCRGKKTTKKKKTKTTCRTTTRKTSNKKPVENKPRTQPVRSSSRTLAEQRRERYGIGSAPLLLPSRTRQKKVDYLKLNDGLSNISEPALSPKSKRRRNHLPARSGPSLGRQKAQNTVTSPPAQVLALSRHNIDNNPNEISGVHNQQPNTLPEAAPSSLQEKISDLSGVQASVETSTTKNQNDVSGVQLPVSGVRDVVPSNMGNIDVGITCDVTQVDLAANTYPNVDNSNQNVDADTLPDLVVNSLNAAVNLTPNLSDRNIIPPIGERPPEHLFDGATTEEDFDAVDALLSLSTVRTNSYEDDDENSTLMPIGSSSRFVDVNPVQIQLDQTTVDGAIAQIVEDEQNSTIEMSTTKSEVDNVKKGASGDEQIEDAIISQNQCSGENKSDSGDNCNNYDDETEIDVSENEQTKKGYVKLTAHGLKKKQNTNGRSYRCTICGKTKRTARRLNVHHRRNHSAQMCGICGKIFVLASSLTHHMYTHDERRYHCDKCSYHSHFESDLKKHNITHHSTPPTSVYAPQMWALVYA